MKHASMVFISLLAALAAKPAASETNPDLLPVIPMIGGKARRVVL